MRVVVTGGGSAGHVIPVLAVVAEIKALRPDAEVVFIRQIGDGATLEMINSDDVSNIDEVRAIAAGKFRRFHGIPWYKQATFVSVQLKNLRDALFFAFGLVQSFFMMLFNRPDVVFVKGGYVGLPVGLAATVLNIPLVIHESDTHMGLTNKILSKYASAVGVGMPLDNYQFGDVEVKFVGVPVSSDYRLVDEKLEATYRKQLGIDPNSKVVVITGGSQGAQMINAAAVAIAKNLSAKVTIIHQTGAETYEATKEALRAELGGETPDNYLLLPFIEKDMHVYLGAGDVVISRAGNTVMSELAISAKPLVLIPNPKLVYGHQLTNAKAYEKAGAAVVVDEQEMQDDPNVLLETVLGLLESPEKLSELSASLHELAKPQAATDIAKLIISKA